MSTQSEFQEELRGWFTGRLPQDWFDGPPEITVDREEITVVGRLSPPALGPDATDAERSGAATGRAKGFREDTRDARIRIAREAEHRFGQKVSWGVEVSGVEVSGVDVSDVEGRRFMFTTLSLPVMTRLRQSERQVLDTLVDAGVARSRSEALAWCVKLVGRNTEAWLADLRSAMENVQRVRAQGPDAG